MDRSIPYHVWIGSDAHDVLLSFFTTLDQYNCFDPVGRT